MWNVASSKGQGVNFHGGMLNGNNLVYSPITIKNGVVAVSPVYYGMLAFKYGNTGGKIIPAHIKEAGYNCSAYACVNSDNSYSITLINKETTKNFSFTLQLSKAAGGIQVVRLDAPSVTSTAGIKLAGSTVEADGTFKPGAPEEYTGNTNHIVVNVPAGSAAIVTVH
jgi:hypothetical protein